MEAVKVYTVPFEITYTYTREIGKFFKKQKQDSVTFQISQTVTARNLRRAVRKAHEIMHTKATKNVDKCNEARGRNEYFNLTGEEAISGKTITIDRIVSIDKIDIKNKTNVTITKMGRG